MQWTPAAMQVLEEYLETLRRASAESGADPKEVVEDIRYHIEEVLRRQAHDVVTAEDVRRLVERLGIPAGVHKITLRSNVRVLTEPAIRWWKSHWELVLGVALPALALIAHVAGGWGSSRWTSLLPTPIHWVLGVLVPVAVAMAWRIRRTSPDYPLWLQLCIGAAAGVAGYYAWVVGLTPLSVPRHLAPILQTRLFLAAPLLALLATGSFWRYLRHRGGTRMWAGAAVALGILLGFNAPQTWTRVGMDWALSAPDSRRALGLSMLRRYADENLLRTACYSQEVGVLPGHGVRIFLHPTDVIGRINPRHFQPEDVQGLYYRVFGVSFNSQAAPEGLSVQAQAAGSRVGERVPGLSLRSSHFDVKPFPASLAAYFEWTMEFQNDTGAQQEARAHISLPPGAIVSRLTLWVNDQEREAVFHETARVREAYRVVTSYRRDPVLVTSAGLDRVMLQCFPVPPSGRLKTRVGITVPLAPRETHAALHGPLFLERNFELGQDFLHSLWVEDAPGGKALSPTLSDSFLSSGKPWAAYTFDPRVTTVGAKDPVSQGRFITQAVTFRPDGGDRVLVIDGSSALGTLREDVKALIKLVPPDTRILLARDDDPLQRAASNWLDGFDAVQFRHGYDNLPALLQALSAGHADRPLRVVWLHGPQAVELRPVDPLRRMLERNPRLTLISHQLVPGPHRILEALDGLPNVQSLRPDRGAQYDLGRLFQEDPWAWQVSRSTASARQGAALATDHIARLWARDFVTAQLHWTSDNVSPTRAPSLAQAIQEAIAHRIVTPLTGAVVLETDQQYQITGLVSPVISPGVSGTGRVLPSMGLTRALAVFVPLRGSFRMEPPWFDPSFSLGALSSPIAVAGSEMGMDGSRRSRLEPAARYAWAHHWQALGMASPFPQVDQRKLSTWIALIPLVLLMIYQYRSSPRNKPWAWTTGAVFLYVVTWPFVPAIVGLALWVVAAGLLIAIPPVPGFFRRHLPLMFLFLSFPLSPTVLGDLLATLGFHFWDDPGFRNGRDLWYSRLLWSFHEDSWLMVFAATCLSALTPRGYRWLLVSLLPVIIPVAAMFIFAIWG